MTVYFVIHVESITCPLSEVPLCVGMCEQQSYRSSLAEQPTRTSLDLELDLQACRTRQRQLMEELNTLRELKLRLEEPQATEGPELPHWALRDERFRCLLREAQRQVSLQVLFKLRETVASPSSTHTLFVIIRSAKVSKSSVRRRQQRGG